MEAFGSQPLSGVISRKRCRDQLQHDSEPARKSRRLQGKPPAIGSTGDLSVGESRCYTKRQDHQSQLPTPSINSVPLASPRQTICRNRKRSQSDQGDLQYNQSCQGKKRALDRTEDNTLEASGPADPIAYWVNKHAWPAGYSKPDFEMSQPLTRKRSASKMSLDEASSQSLSKGTTLSMDVTREEKAADYQDNRCEVLLETQKSYMGKAPQKINETSQELCKRLLEYEQSVPRDSLFQDNIFERTCENIRSENEARVVLDIMRLIVPSAENVADPAIEPEILKEKVNSSWLKCIPLLTKCPQPDYSVGFRRSAFSLDQLGRLDPFVGTDRERCSVMARYDMYFPFLTCEVKCGAQGLNIANRQNMHNASVSVKGIVELFKRVDRHKDLHKEILAFSVSHDNKRVELYGHYPLIDGDKACFYRHLIRDFSIADQNGKEKWTAYKFTRNVYDIFVPIHLKRLHDAIDKLPSRYNFGVDASLNFASQPDRGDKDDTESLRSSSQNTDTILNTEPTSPSLPGTYSKSAPSRGG